MACSGTHDEVDDNSRSQGLNLKLFVQTNEVDNNNDGDDDDDNTNNNN